VLDIINFPFNLRHTKIIENTNVHKRIEAGAGAGAGAGAMFMKRKALEPEMCKFYDGSAALVISKTPEHWLKLKLFYKH